MTDPGLTWTHGAVRTTLDLDTYRLSAIKKAAYRLADRMTLSLGPAEGRSLPVTFMFPRQTTEPDAVERVRLFFQEVLDQDLRERLAEETQPLRALVLAHAFSRTDLVRR